jgi:hypothetical protein
MDREIKSSIFFTSYPPAYKRLRLAGKINMPVRKADARLSKTGYAIKTWQRLKGKKTGKKKYFFYVRKNALHTF